MKPKRSPLEERSERLRLAIAWPVRLWFGAKAGWQRHRQLESGALASLPSDGRMAIPLSELHRRLSIRLTDVSEDEVFALVALLQKQHRVEVYGNERLGDLVVSRLTETSRRRRPWRRAPVLPFTPSG